MLIRLTLGLLPVFLFLLGLLLLDSFKLVHIRRVLVAVLAGAAAAVLAYHVNSRLWPALEWHLRAYSTSIAPVVEELAKALFIIFLFRRHRIGFFVDAAIYGFAVGAGFAFVENAVIAGRLAQSDLALWIVRGFGTAVMHGGTSAIFAVLARGFLDRRPQRQGLAFAVAAAAAVCLHALYNLFILNPATQAAIILLTLPVVMVLVFQRSESRLRQWLGAGFDSDQQLLEIITSGQISDTRIGRYLHSMRSLFPGPVVADMLCYLRLYVELSISAKGLLLMAEAGFPPKPAAGIREKFAELRYLEKSIGKSGLLVMAPFLHKSHHDLWQIHFLDHRRR